MKFDEILERAVKQVSMDYGIKEEEIWKAIQKFRLKQKLGVK
ncbi:MAG: hypothetical protein QXP56_06980 [Archaeoglobaceae archaeon]